MKGPPISIFISNIPVNQSALHTVRQSQRSGQMRTSASGRPHVAHGRPP